MRSLKKFAGAALAAALFLLPVSGARAQSAEQAAARKKTIADLKEVGYAGDVMAQVRLGVIYLTGDGVPKDDVEAVKWLRMAANQDNPVAERFLAEMYFKGRGVAADNEEAAKWLRMAADQGDAQSQYNLAVLYSQGQGVPRNLKESLSWMTKAAEQNLAAGQMGLGVAYGNGDGVLANPAVAAAWYQKAVDQNYVPAMSNLAMLLATTTNAAVRNPKQAIALATRAVGGGSNPDYLNTLAAAYFADGQTDQAVATEEKALGRDPENDAYKKAYEKYQAAAHAGR
jgi:TPR repeat protein